MSPPITTILFDLDGTLVDTAPDLAFALNTLRAQQGLPALPYADIRPIASEGTPGLLKLGFNLTPTDPDYPALRAKYLAIYENYLYHHSSLFAGIDTLLSAIEKAGKRWGVMTNKPQYLSERLLAQAALLHRAACLVGGDRVANIKPAPDGLLACCAQLQVTPAQCIYVGDARRDMQAAKHANMLCIAALYGYIADHDNPQQWPADYFVKQPSELYLYLNL